MWRQATVSRQRRCQQGQALNFVKQLIIDMIDNFLKLTSGEISTDGCEVEWGNSQNETFESTVLDATFEILLDAESRGICTTHFQAPGAFFEGC